MRKAPGSFPEAFMIIVCMRCFLRRQKLFPHIQGQPGGNAAALREGVHRRRFLHLGVGLRQGLQMLRAIVAQPLAQAVQSRDDRLHRLAVPGAPLGIVIQPFNHASASVDNSGRRKSSAYRAICSSDKLPKDSLSGGAAQRKKVPATTS